VDFLILKKIIEELDIKEGMEIADFGCGAGYFTISMAKAVGQRGKVYSLDVLKTALESVHSKAKVEGLLNIESIWSNLEVANGSKLENESMDLVLSANILFQSTQKAGIIKEAKRVLKSKGKMVIIEWRENQLMGPSENLIISKNLAQDLVEKEGLKLEKEFPAGDNHWGIIFIKS